MTWEEDDEEEDEEEKTKKKKKEESLGDLKDPRGATSWTAVRRCDWCVDSTCNAGRRTVDR